VPSPSRNTLLPAAMLALVALGGCSKDDNIELANDSIGLRITRSACPAVGIPAYTGDVTFFATPAARTANAIDLVAELTDVKANCTDTGTGPLTSTVSFRVEGRRTDAGGAREVTLPYFASAIRGGTVVASKQLGRVALHFDAGQMRAVTNGQASVTLDRASIAIPETVRNRLTKKRKATDADASIDPMTDPEVRSAVNRASFELLVGFQLSNDQLAYNATR
jgi:hypothetical protein